MSPLNLQPSEQKGKDMRPDYEGLYPQGKVVTLEDFKKKYGTETVNIFLTNLLDQIPELHPVLKELYAELQKDLNDLLGKEK